MGSELVCVGVVAGARGIKGEVRIKPFTASPGDVAAYGPVRNEDGTREWTVRVTGAAKGLLIARIAGVADRNAAEALKGQKLYVPRDALPQAEDDEFYHADLVGLAAEFADGSRMGRIKAVHDFGAGTMLEVRPPTGNGIMVPFTRAAVPVVDLKGKRIVVDPPPGLLEPAERDEEEKG